MNQAASIRCNFSASSMNAVHTVAFLREAGSHMLKIGINERRCNAAGGNRFIVRVVCCNSMTQLKGASFNSRG